MAAEASSAFSLLAGLYVEVTLKSRWLEKLSSSWLGWGTLGLSFENWGWGVGRFNEGQNALGVHAKSLQKSPFTIFLLRRSVCNCVLIISKLDVFNVYRAVFRHDLRIKSGFLLFLTFLSKFFSFWSNLCENGSGNVLAFLSDSIYKIISSPHGLLTSSFNWIFFIDKLKWWRMGFELRWVYLTLVLEWK